jgi:hypothetical protein
MKKIYLLFLISMLPMGALLAQSAGKALDLDGEDDYVWAPANVSELPEGTLEMWFASKGDNLVMLAIGGSGFPGYNFDGGYRLGEHFTAGTGLPFGIYISPWMWLQSGLEVETGVWYHVACTWGYYGMKMYINGEFMGEFGYDGPTGDYVYDLIGASSWADKFDGMIDEVRYWNFARDSSQINETMWDTLSTEYITNPEFGLLAYYKFDEMEDLAIDQDGADDFRDFSVNGNHADSRGEVALVQSGAFGPAGIGDDNILPDQNSHLQNIYPNPFQSQATITFYASQPEKVTLEVYNFLGEKVATLFSEDVSRGEHVLEWSANGICGGVYFLELVTSSNRDVRRVMVMR